MIVRRPIAWFCCHLLAVACLTAVRADETSPADGRPADSRPAAGADQRQQHIQSLIEQLGADDYFARQRAQQELAALGFEAFDALTEAENHEDIEIGLRARYLVRLMNVAWVVESDPPEVKSLLEDYESKSEPERIALIKRLAALEDDDGLAVLCRMVRFEKSLILSKEAAAAVLTGPTPDEPRARQRREQIVRRIVGRASRPAVVWLQTYLTGLDDPAAALAPWQDLLAREERLALDAPQQTRPELVGALRRELAVLLRRSGRDEEANALLQKIAAREPETATSEELMELLDWLTEQKADAAIDQVAARFEDRFDKEPMLLYALARIRQARGDTEAAQETVQKALALNGGREDAASRHFAVALQLLQRYWSEFVAGEFQRVIDLAKPGDRQSLMAHFQLGEILHDRGDDLAAAKIVEAGIAAAEAAAGDTAIDASGPYFQSKRARMHYFHSCQLTSPNDRARRIEHLRAALDADATDADVLIALDREKDLDPPLREDTRKKMAAAADKFRGEIQQEPDNPSPYNQLAWLLANTDGDRHEALRCSQKSLELVRGDPDAAGSEASFLDTLAHCYSALGDYENAVKYQARAVKLDRHSGLMNKALDEFRAARDKNPSPPIKVQ